MGILSIRPDILDKCYKEIEACIENNEKIIIEQCPYLRAVLIENLRFRPVVDSLLHRVTQDTEIAGYFVQKNSFVQASLTAVMHDPNNFEFPNQFIPERHLEQGKFKHNAKICPFSIGLRSCVGKNLAFQEYFSFASNIIRRFEIKLDDSLSKISEHILLEPISHEGVLIPKNYKIIFNTRSSEHS